MSESPVYKLDTYFQLRVISCIFKDTNFMMQCRDFINPLYFESEEHRFFATIGIDYFDRYNVTPTYENANTILLTYLEVMDDKLVGSYMNVLHKVYHTDINDLQFIIDNVIPFGEEQRAKRKILEASLLVNSNYSKNKSKIETLLTEATTTSIATKERVITFIKDSLDLPKELAMRTADPLYALIPTISKQFDKAIGGGLGMHQVMFVIGLPGLGKSNCLINAAVNASISGKNVLFISNELPDIDVRSRLAACMSGMDINKLSDLSRYDEYVSKMSPYQMICGQIDVQYYSPYQMHISHLKSLIHNAQNFRGLKYDILIIDAFYRIGGIDPHTGWQGEGKVSKELISLLKQTDMRAIVSDQPKKGVDPNALLHYLQMGGEGDKYQDADLVVSLNQTPHQRESMLAKLYVSKARQLGLDATIDLYYDRNVTMKMLDYQDYINSMHSLQNAQMQNMIPDFSS